MFYLVCVSILDRYVFFGAYSDSFMENNVLFEMCSYWTDMFSLELVTLSWKIMFYLEAVTFS